MSDNITCYKCGIVFGVPDHWLESRREDKESFWCPNGHSQAFVESTADRLKRDLDRAKQNEAWLNDRIKAAQDDAEHERRRRIAAIGQVTKMKKRAQAGTCPCCNRTFKQLTAHMANKHPGFICEPVEGSNIIPLEKRAFTPIGEETK